MIIQERNKTMSNGRYGDFGGQYIPETLMNEIHKLEEAYEFYKNDKQFNDELNALLRDYAGRPSLLYYAEKMTKDLGGAKIYFKREDLNHTGSHKINNVLGQALLAKKFAGVGLDVYEEEEGVFYEDRSNDIDIIKDENLVRLTAFPNVLITSHMGFFTKEATREIARVTLENAYALENGNPLVNEVVWDRG